MTDIFNRNTIENNCVCSFESLVQSRRPPIPLAAETILETTIASMQTDDGSASASASEELEDSIFKAYTLLSRRG